MEEHVECSLAIGAFDVVVDKVEKVVQSALFRPKA